MLDSIIPQNITQEHQYRSSRPRLTISYLSISTDFVTQIESTAEKIERMTGLMFC
jgi:hypothetical protein